MKLHFFHSASVQGKGGGGNHAIAIFLPACLSPNLQFLAKFSPEAATRLGQARDDGRNYVQGGGGKAARDVK